MNIIIITKWAVYGLVLQYRIMSLEYSTVTQPVTLPSRCNNNTRTHWAARLDG